MCRLLIIYYVSLYTLFTAFARPCSKKVLVVMSSADSITLTNGNKHTTGFYLDELSQPSLALINAGWDLSFTNPEGNSPPMDPASNSSKYFESLNAWVTAQNWVSNPSNPLHKPRLLSSSTRDEIDQFDSVFFPGGHAPMVDLWNDSFVGKILIVFHELNRPTGAICHGPVSLLASLNLSTPWVYQGYTMTVFSTAEETVNEILWGGFLPWLPQTVLSSNGGNVNVGLPLFSHIEEDRELLTGQNPWSANDFAQKFVTKILASCSK